MGIFGSPQYGAQFWSFVTDNNGEIASGWVNVPPGGASDVYGDSKSVHVQLNPGTNIYLYCDPGAPMSVLLAGQLVSLP